MSAATVICDLCDDGKCTNACRPKLIDSMRGVAKMLREMASNKKGGVWIDSHAMKDVADFLDEEVANRCLSDDVYIVAF